MKAQMWFMDFVIGIVIFSLMLVSYYVYTTNISKEDTAALDDLTSDSKTVASSLTSPGFPDNWDSNTATRIGFTDNHNRIDNAKFSEFAEINYNKSKKLLGTVYDYFLFFVNESMDVQNIEGFCGIGNSLVNITYYTKAAYYYQNEDEEQLLKPFMETEFDADVYCDGGPTCNYLPLDGPTGLISNIDDYNFIVVEHPAWSDAQLNNFVAAAESWVQAGGILFLGGGMGVSMQSDGFNVKFKKKIGADDKRATIINEDEYLTFKWTGNVEFADYFYAEDDGVVGDFIDIARFNESEIEYNDILDNDIAIARWPYGSGRIFYFSDFDATYFNGNFLQYLEDAAIKWANVACLSIDISNVDRNNLIKVERMAVYKSDLIKMVLYLWS